MIYLLKKKEINIISTNTGSVMGGTILSIYGYYFYSDDNLPAIIQVGGKKFYFDSIILFQFFK